ncbi:MAG TPA: ABC transporter substrate-binding protein, partial [Candidatus Acidoferrales bacterium]|nr:ABC transporter substrate-binding protein [Candidatus Acidoferrales bacterium]
MPRALRALLFLSSVLSACASPPPERKDVVVGLVGEPASVFADDPGARFIAAAVTEPLVGLDSRDELVARLAVNVPTVENGELRIVSDEANTTHLVATFRLRDGLRWQDGEPITADDVRFAHDQDVAAAPGSVTRWLADRIDAVDVVDDHFVRVTYRADERWDAYALAPRVLPRHILAGADAAKRAAYEREPVHAGAFSVAAWVAGYGVTLAAFKDHVGGAPALGRIEVRFFHDRDAVLDALRRGDVDVAPSPDLEADLARTLDRFGDQNHVDVFYTASESLEMLRFGTRGLFADHAVRRAVELTVDRQGLVDDIFAGRARVPPTYLVPPLWASAENGAATRPDRDAARQLLIDAGFTKGAYGILERGGARMTVTLQVASGSSPRLEAARRIAGDLAAVGIAVEVRAHPPAELEATVAKGEFDLALLPEDASDPMRATERWTSLGDPWFDVLAAAARRASGRDEQRLLYSELQRIWSDDLPGLP